MLLKYWRLIVLGLVVFFLMGGIFWLVNKFILREGWADEEAKVYQVLVSVYDEKNANPIEDKKSSMKKGYVIGVYPENHQWSETEKISYLILKMKLNKREAQEIIEPIQKNIDIRILSEEQQKVIKESDIKEEQKEIIAVRKYKIDLEKIGFSDPNSLLNGQPYEDNVFGWEIVEKIN